MRSVDIIKAFKESEQYENYNLIFNFSRNKGNYFILHAEIDNDNLYITECRKPKIYIAINLNQINKYIKSILDGKVFCIVDQCDTNLSNKIIMTQEDTVELMNTDRYSVYNGYLVEIESRMDVMVREDGRYEKEGKMMKISNVCGYVYVGNIYFSSVFSDRREEKLC